MTTLTRKQRERVEREQLILDVARLALAEQGYLGLNMDRIAEATEYSKGTIYQHYSSKEDLLGALTVETMEKRAEMFMRAVAFEGKPRERLMAIGVADELFFRLNPVHFRTEQITRISSIAAKITPERREVLEALQQSCYDRVRSVVQDGIDAGDLVPREGKPECQVLYGLRSMAVGSHSLRGQVGALRDMEDVDLDQALWDNYAMLLDGYGWKPLSTEWDYHATYQRILQEVFSDEYRKVQAA